MILPLQFQCEASGCKAVRTDTNHWFAVRYYEDTGTIVIRTWEEARKIMSLETSSHFCGQTHALQYVSSLMGKTEGK